MLGLINLVPTAFYLFAFYKNKNSEKTRSSGNEVGFDGERKGREKWNILGISKRILYFQNRQKTVWRSVFLLIRYSKYSAILSKYTPTDCFFVILPTGEEMEI